MTEERQGHAVAVDLLGVAAIALLSAAAYVARLGFYSDDWGLLAGFEAAARSQSTIPVALSFDSRPVQGLYLALLFTLFGFDPLGYHLVNTAVLAAGLSLFYLLLIRLQIGRAYALSAALIFLMLPQLSTARAWYAAFQVPLSFALMLVSMHAQLSYARSKSAGWLVVALVAALLSIGAYEIFAPLLAAFTIALGYDAFRNLPDRAKSKLRIPIWPALILAAMAAAVLFKLLSSGRTGALGDADRYLLGLYQLVRPDYDWRIHSGLNILAAARAHFWAPLQGWASGGQALVNGSAPALVTGLAIAIGALAWWRLRTCRAKADRAGAKRLLLLGMATFLLGHATFLIVPSIHFSSTGIGNRVHVAAAIGVAMIFAVLLVGAANLVAERWRRAALATAVTAVVVSGFVRIAAIERYWAEVPRLQDRVIQAVRSDLRHLAAGSTVILDGVCPYHGPAIVFEASWDVSGALTLALGREIRGDTVSPRMSLTSTGIETSIYKQPSVYPYGPGLYVYNPTTHRLARLGDRAAAVEYFRNREPLRCPEGFVGRGVKI